MAGGGKREGRGRGRQNCSGTESVSGSARYGFLSLSLLGNFHSRIRTITTYFNSIRIEICCYCSYSISRPLPYLPRPRPSPQFPGRLQVYGYTSWYFAILYPLYTGGLFHCYMLDEPICHYRGVRSFLSLLFYI